jgi:7-cyano-7-deazaguanine synthase
MSIGIGELGGSALTDEKIGIPDLASDGIPVTYVPARNTVFLSLALGWAEVLEAESIFIGVNAVDYSGYPDCRPEYIEAFQAMADLATRKSVEGSPIRIETPLIHLSKAEIISVGESLGVDYSMTISCYQPDDVGAACGRCDACRLRAAGFETAGIADPAP